MLADTDRAIDALHAIPPDLERGSWVRAGMAAHAAGLDFDTFNDWSAGGGNYNETAACETWRSFKPGKGVGAGTLYRMAAEHGWRMNGDKPQSKRKPPRPTVAPAKPRPGMGAAEIWECCEAATNSHPYVAKKNAAGVSLDNLRVVPAGDSLMIQGESMVGALVVPVTRVDGTLSSLQFIVAPDVAARLKAKDKLNLPSHTVQGWFTVGELVALGSVVYICEGTSQRQGRAVGAQHGTRGINCFRGPNG